MEILILKHSEYQAFMETLKRIQSLINYLYPEQEMIIIINVTNKGKNLI